MAATSAITREMAKLNSNEEDNHNNEHSFLAFTNDMEEDEADVDAD